MASDTVICQTSLPTEIDNRVCIAHYVPRVKDKDKREVAFSLVPFNLGKKGKGCSYSARLTHNQVQGDHRFDGEIAAGPYQIVLRRMNADGKSYALARLKAEVVAQETLRP